MQFLNRPSGNRRNAAEKLAKAGAVKEEIAVYRFLIVIEKAGDNYSAYVPDLPGCIATGKTREEAEQNMHEAIQMHVQGLPEDNLPIPESQSFAEFVIVQ